MIKTLYLLTKPGIILGNIITTIAGFALASKNQFRWLYFPRHNSKPLPTFVIASACVLNNYIDRDSGQEDDKDKT